MITPLHAAPQAPAGFDFAQLLPLVFVFVLMYFFLMRPQQKKAQKQKEFLAALKVGETVLLQSGLIGKVHQLTNDQEVLLELCPEVYVRTLRASITQKVEAKPPKSVKAIHQKTDGGKKTSRQQGGRRRKVSGEM